MKKKDEIEFLLVHAARYLTRDPTRFDILSAWAGLRPLVKAGAARRTAKLSRDHTILVSTSGLVTVAGGKWTTYRQMAEETIDRAAETASLPPRPSATRDLRLHGWLTPEESQAALHVYGADSTAVAALSADHPAWDQPLDPRLPIRGREVVWAARHELARTVEDVLARRTRALFLDARASAAVAPQVAALLAHELGRDPAWETRQINEFQNLAKAYLPSGT